MSLNFTFGHKEDIILTAKKGLQNISGDKSQNCDIDVSLNSLNGAKQCKIRPMSRITFQYADNNDVNIVNVLGFGSRVLFGSVRFIVHS